MGTVTTPLFGLPAPDGADDVRNGDNQMRALAQAAEDTIEEIATNAGVNTPGGVRRGKSIIATEESTTSTSYVLLSTPDRVQSIELPEDGLIIVSYRALWRTVGAEAAIFLGSNQVKAAAASSSGIDIAGTPENSSDSSYGQLLSTATGLGGATAFGGHASFNANGQALGLRGNHAVTVNGSYTESTSMPNDGWGGLCVIEAAAGTYDVSVRFRHVSGTQTYVKDRKLRVWTEAF